MMHWNSILVTLLGIGLIYWILEYFLGGSRTSRAARVEDGLQRVRIQVKGGYDPARIELKRGVPAVLEFHREEEDACSERVLLDAFGLSAFLPPYETTRIEFTPERSGRFPFTCGMGMLKGEIVVTES